MSHAAPPNPPTQSPIMRLWSDSLDLRSLALMRVLLGVLLISHLLAALPDAAALWSDAGVLPRTRLLEVAPATLFSLQLANGSALFTVTLMSLQLILAVLLLAGWRSRTMAGISFVLWISLCARNPAASAQSDLLLAWLLLWAAWLPVGARYGIDAALQKASPADAQWSSALAGLGRLFWVSAFLFAAVTDPAIGLPTLVLVCAAAVLLLLPLPPRASRIAGMLGALCLLLPLLVLLARAPQSAAAWVALAAWSPLLDSSAWHWLRRVLAPRSPALASLRVYYDGECPYCARISHLLVCALMVPEAACLPAQSQARARTLLEANDSWVVIDGADEAHLRWSAFVVLLQASLLFGPLARAMSGVLTRPNWVAAGDRIYALLTRNRPRLGRLSCWMDCGESNSVASRHWTVWLATLLVMLAIAAQASQAGWLRAGWRPAFAAPLEVTGLGAEWRHALSSLPAEPGWLLVSGQRADGGEVDVLRPWLDELRIAPPEESAAQDGLYWRRYRKALLDEHWQALRPGYADYLCRVWNRAADPGEALLKLRLIALQPTVGGGDAAVLEQRELLRYACR